MNISKLNKELKDANEEVDKMGNLLWLKSKQLYNAVKLEKVGENNTCAWCGDKFNEGMMMFKKRRQVKHYCQKCFFERVYFTEEEAEEVFNTLKNCILKQHKILKRYKNEIDKQNVVAVL